MTTLVDVGEADDPYFIEVLNRLIRGLISYVKPAQLWVVQIDNWFDQKWLRFSGIGSVDFQFPAYMNRYDAALQGFYQEKITFPPFHPNRVIRQWSFVRVGNDYKEAPLPTLPHASERQPSGANLQRRVERFGRSACFVWYSGNTIANGKASVMVYTIVDDRIDCWFAAFGRQVEWSLLATKGVNRDAVDGLLSVRASDNE